MKELHDVIVIGGGPCGLATALTAAKLGLRVLLLEKRSAYEDAPDHLRRFQAVVVDETTLNNLVYLGIKVRKGDGFHELTRANFQSSVREDDGFANYHPMPDQLLGNPCGDLSKVGFRRKIVAVTSIRDIEDRLYQAVRDNPSIDAHFDTEVKAIENRRDGVSVSVSHDASGHATFKANWLAVADGANSHTKGALKLLGIRKQPVAAPIRVVAARYRSEGRAGELCIREALDEQHRHTAFFGLKDESVIYTDVPEQVRAEEPRIAAAYMSQIAPKLKLSELIGTPLLVSQQAMIADRFKHNRVVVLGDAAFSGTAVLGVYLNKAICDAIGFGEFIQTGQRTNEALAPSVYQQFIAEENLVSFAYNYRGTGQMPGVVRDLLEALPRSAFRLKSGRYGLPRSLMRNYVDLASVAVRSVAERSPMQNSPWQQGLLFSSRMMRTIGEVLEPSQDTRRI